MPTNHRTYWLPAAIVLAFWAVAVFAVITYINTVAIQQSENLAIQARDLREATQQVLSAMKDIETGQRGFLLTGDPDFLTPYDIGRKKAAEQLAELNRLTKDDKAVRAMWLGWSKLFSNNMRIWQIRLPSDARHLKSASAMKYSTW